MGANWQQFGIPPILVERVKMKIKNPVVKDQIKALMEGVTKQDLQNRAKVRQLVRAAAHILNEPLTNAMEAQLVEFVLAQKIDPHNTLHLLKLWAMFR